MSAEYYSLEDVMKLLAKSRSTVLREAKSGLIPSEIEEGKTKGRRYPKQAIDALVEIQKKKQKTKLDKYAFSYSTPNDLWAEVSIGRELYGDDDIVPFKQLLEWRDINDEIFMSLKDNGKVAAYCSFMPVDESVILPLVEDKIREHDIPLHAIRQWTDPQLSVYAASITVKPTGDTGTDTEIGSLILRHALKWALSLHRQCDIKNWYAIGATHAGQELLEDIGFSEYISLNNGERKGYTLDNIEKPAKTVYRLLSNASRREATVSK